MICSEHFDDDDFKRKNKTELKAKAIPKLYKNQQDPHIPSCSSIGLNSLNDLHDPDVTTEVTAGTVETAEISGNECQNSECKSCQKKDKLIKVKEMRIKHLSQILNKNRTKIFHLERTKYKLNMTLSEMKERHLLNADLLKALEVKEILL